MTIRQNPPTGAPCWVDLMSSDLAKSKAFYGELFGWVVGEPAEEFGGYRTFELDGEQVAGLMARQDDGVPMDLWSVYLAVTDTEATVGAVEAAGGQVYSGAMAVGDLGVMAIVADPAGAMIGMWQPGEHRGGVVATDGAPCHWELWTRDHDASLGFYESVFGWQGRTTTHSEPGFTYTTLDIADGENAGVMDASGFLPEGVPSHWSVYFAVDDVHKTLERVEALGGSIVQAAEDTPYGVLATASDSTGAIFKLRGDTAS
jgi:predicted enzyme related to lactoylglutathione lyase